MTIPCKLKYRVRGITNQHDSATSLDVSEEIQEILGHVDMVTVKPTEQGLEIELSVTDIEPFEPNDFEPYVYEQVVLHTVFACCEMGEDDCEFNLIYSSLDKS